MTIEELEQIAKSVCQENEKYDFEVNVCMDLACSSQGAQQLKDALVKAAETSGKNVHIRRTGCMGPCSSGPLVRVDPVSYTHLDVYKRQLPIRLDNHPEHGVETDPGQ